MSSISRTFRRAVAWLAESSIAASHLLLGAGVALGVLGTYRYASDHFQMDSFGATGLLVAALLIALAVAGSIGSIHLAKRRTPLDPRIFVPAVLLGGLAIHLVLVATIKPQWGTDYLRYWEYAQELIRRGEYSGLNAPYYSRSLFIPYPIIRIFGPEATLVLKLVNVVLLGAMQFIVYDILRRIRSHQAAQAGSLILLLAPLPAYVTLIPSHDLWGTFFLTTTVWLAVCAIDASRRRPARWCLWVALAAAAGAIAFLTEVQRNMGLIFCVGLLLAASLDWAAHASRGYADGSRHPRQSLLAVCIAALCLAGFVGASLADRSLKLNSEARPILTNMKFAANGGGMGNGKSDWFARFRDRFIDKQASAEEARDFARSSALSSWALQPADRATRLAVHASRLFSMTYPRDWNWVLRKPEGRSEATRQALIFYADAFGLAFGLLLVFAIARLASWRRPAPSVVSAFSMLLVAVSLILLLVFENKPYNIFPIWIFGALAIGLAFSAGHRDTAAPLRAPGLLSNPGLGGGILIAVAALVLPFAVRGAYSVADGRLLSDWTFEAIQQESPVNPHWAAELVGARPEAFDAHAYDPDTLGQNYISQSGEDGDRIRRYAGDAVTRMQFPAPVRSGDSLHMSTPVCTGRSGRTRLEFFIYSPASLSADDADFTLDITSDGRQSPGIRIPLEGRNFQRFVVDHAFAGGACHVFSLRLHANSPGSLDGTDHGPFIEVWMPRLIH
ncbi:hypothetical protein GCM10007164_17710 [Luteimonas padinae]|uniref:Glycosyltransferase family 39 protein n=1 Tax=Luteimonas padinae TaxID=1714359 RepID=A0ABV6SYL4_9GAMM|nr:glycosyltransferase family 39 protein [Luteimonas padinae]GHD71455.1 hypothetical protein GCM10007164_17710 [Luteimonas padinae]